MRTSLQTYESSWEHNSCVNWITEIENQSIIKRNHYPYHLPDYKVSLNPIQENSKKTFVSFKLESAGEGGGGGKKMLIFFNCHRPHCPINTQILL
jgi:hypothetical protein